MYCKLLLSFALFEFYINKQILNTHQVPFNFTVFMKINLEINHISFSYYTTFLITICSEANQYLIL